MINEAAIEKMDLTFSNRSEVIPPTNSRLDRWIDLSVFEPSNRLNLARLRILGFLFTQSDQVRGSTKSQIAVTLNLLEDQVGELLASLSRQGLICNEPIPFGIDLFGRQKTIRVYHITELGRFFIHHLDVKFPGIWLTKVRTGP